MALADAAANRLLEDEPWARERLAAYAGRTFMLRIGLVASGFRIDERGLFGHAPLAGVTPDLVLTLSPFNVPAFLADPKRWSEFVAQDGDVALAGVLRELAQTLPWFVERLCARSLGTIVGLRVADAGRRMLGMPEYATTRIAANVGSYARDEARVLAHPADMRALIEETGLLAARLDALDTRVEALSARIPAAGSRPPGVRSAY
jgi:ubiquinone biosynthesis accessory factor UbiJ